MNGLQRAQTRAAEARQNRACLPLVSQAVDYWRQFFPDARLTYASEAGTEVGRRGQEGVPASDSGPSIKRPRRGG